MSDDALSQPVVIERPDGKTLSFKRCSPADRLAFRSIFRMYRRIGFKACLDLEGVPPKDRAPYYAFFEGRRLYESDVIAWLNEPEGQHEAILLSLRTALPEKERERLTLADVHALDLDRDELLTVAAGVMNVPLSNGKGEGQKPNPLAGGIVSGGETPAPLDTSPATPIPSDSPSTFSSST